MTKEEQERLREKAIKDLEKDKERLDKVQAIFAEALEYLKAGHSLQECEDKFEKKMDEADELLGNVYFGQ